MFASSEVKVVPSSVAVDALRHVVESSASDELVNALEQQEVWQKVQDDEKYWQGYIVLARLVLASCDFLIYRVLTARSLLRKVLFLAPSVCGFLFVYEISWELLNRFVPNSHGRRVWSFAQTTLKVKGQGQQGQKRIFQPIW